MIKRVVDRLIKRNNYSSIESGVNKNNQKTKPQDKKEQGYSFDDQVRYETMNNGVVDIYNFQNSEIMTKEERIMMEQKIILPNPEGEYVL